MSNELIKVMIVDDEPLVRNLLKSCINWEDIGMEIAGESASALEGIEMVDRILPDIIFTDICMPVMDGLEFSKRVIEKHPGIKIVILTGHEEFEYAKKGIKVGVADFLLKPINDEEITRTALTIKEKLVAERMLTEEYERLKEQLRQNMPFLREKVLNELIQGSADLKSVKDRMAYFDIKVKEDIFQAAVIEIFSAEEVDPTDEEKELIYKMRCLELTRRFFDKDPFVQVFFDNSQRIVVLCNESSVDLGECCEMIKSMLINRLKCFVCIGIGNAYDGMDRVWMSYKEACDALRYRFIVGKNQVISFSDIYFSQEVRTNVDSNLMGNFCFYLKSGLKDKWEELINAVFSETEPGVSTKEQARVFACNFVANVLNVLMESGIKQEEVFTENSQPFETVFKLDTLPDMKDYLKNISYKASQAVNSMRAKRARKIIQDVKEYIDDNFSNSNLTLSEVAKKFYVNLSYLSRIFKEETGYTFVDYIIKLRMEKAIKLLDETDKKAYEIAEEVGINDPHYFSACFKKYTGVSINQYKKSR